ncbi:MAG: leucine-rich repeat protein, partial [Alistipes sp.]|nr:leucine-rich repeat protein [Alistipes sp.]
MKRFLSIFLAIFALTLAACTSSDEENGNNSQGGGDKPSSQPEVTITTPPAPTVSEKGGNDIIAFHAEKPWSAKVLNTRAEGWCSIYPTSGQAGDVEITITTAPNDTDDDRSATIIIQAGSTQIVITITQKQQDALTVTASKFEVEAEGGEVEIEVKANVDYDYTIDPDAADWVKYKATRALESSTLVFEVAENEDMEKREAQIMIHSGDLEELVTIYQEGNEPTIILSKNEYTVSDKGETIAVEVKSNVDVAVEIPSDVDWVKENSTRAMSTNTFYLDVAPNEDYKSRSAAVKFTNKENGLSEIVMISQAQMDAIVIAKDSYTIDNEGGEIDIEVGHNVDFDVEISDSWITKTSTRAFETETLTFTIAANNSDDGREGTIKFISKDKSISQTVKVFQSQSNALIVSKKDIVIDEKAQSVEFEVRANVECTVSSSSASWLHREDTRAMTSQTIRYRVDANSDYNSRTATITVQSKDGSLKETITITQAQKDAIVLAKSSYTVDNDGGEIDIEIGHNVDFDVEISDNWITKTSTRAFETETLTFTIAANNSDDSREGTIKFISKDKTITQTVKVYQSQSNALIVSKKDIVIDEKAQTVEFEVRANVEYTVSASSASWLHREDTRAMTSQTIRYRVDANSDYDSRTATITVQSKDGSLKETITVTQAQKDAIVLAKSSYTVDNDGGEIDIEVGHNVDFDVEISDSWITNNSTRAFETETLTFTIAANNSDDSREGTIKFISKDKAITQTVKIKQGAASTKPRNNEIWYTSANGEIVEPYEDADFGANIISNTYSNGKGVIKFDRSINKIPDSAFDTDYISNYQLKTITLPDGIKTIGEYAFYSCYYLESINIPYGVTTIGYEAFASCVSLSEITLPYSLTELGDLAFVYCYSLKSFNGKFASADHRCLITDDGMLHTYALGCGATSYTIPSNAKSIAYYAFANCEDLRSVTLPNSITDLGYAIFIGCNALESFNGKFASSDKRCLVIDDTILAFAPAGLSSYTIADNISGIYHFAFCQCDKLTKVVLPSSMSFMGYSVFRECSSLKGVYCKAATPPTAYNGGAEYWLSFDNNAYDRKIYVPKNSVTAYKAADGWKEYADAIVADTSGDGEQDDDQDPTKPRNNEIWYTSTDGKIVTPHYSNEFGANIVSNTYEDGKGIITFDGNVTEIGDKAFYDCSSLTSVTIPDSVTEIGWYAFQRCSSLTTITI